MTDKPTPTTDLLKRCAEIHEWRSTGVLSGEALRDYAKRRWPDRLDTLQMLEHETVTEALELLAKWGTPAGAGEAAEHYRNAIASACEGWTMPDGLRKHLETALWSQPTQTQAGAVTDAQVLAAVRVVSPGLFRHGLQPLPNDGANTAAQMRKGADTVRKMLEAAHGIKQGASHDR